MKRKLDFVTNSSSASFIIGAMKETSLKVPITLEVDLTEFIRRTITTQEELEKYWIDECCNDRDDFTYIQCQSIIEAGEVVYFLRCSDQDGPVEGMLCNVGLDGKSIPKNIKVIKGEGGY